MNAQSPVYGLDFSDRKFIVERLLNRLTPEQQFEFVTWCCSRGDELHKGSYIEPPINNTGEAWLILCHLATQHGLDFDAAMHELERRVRLLNVFPHANQIRLIRPWE